MFKIYKIFTLALILMLVQSACSSVKTYNDLADKNLVFKTIIDDDVKVAIDIYRVDNACKLSYLGTHNIEQEITKAGLPQDTSLFLVVRFSKSSFLSSSSSSLSQEIYLFTSRAYRYQLDLSYEDAIYDVQIRSINRKTGKSKIIETVIFDACR